MNTKLLITLFLALILLAGCKSDGVVDTDRVDELLATDSDGDGIANGSDNCPIVPNPDQLDLDGDGAGNACDSDRDGDGQENQLDECPDDPSNASGCEASKDTDQDGIADQNDNCPTLANPGQEDSNGNGIGDACDLDGDSDGIPDQNDNCPALANADQTDTDGDGIGDACDPVADSDPAAYQCAAAPLAAPFRPLLAPAAVASGETDGLCGLAGTCFVENPENAVNAVLTDTATLGVGLGLLGNVARLVITDQSEIYEAPNRLGIAVANPDQLINLNLLSGLTVRTLRDGTVAETFSASELLDLDLLGLLNGEQAGYLVFATSADFDTVEVEIGGLLDLANNLDVFAVCASPEAVSTAP